MSDPDDFDRDRDWLIDVAERVAALQEEVALLRLNMELTRARLETAVRIFENAQETE